MYDGRRFGTKLTNYKQNNEKHETYLKYYRTDRFHCSGRGVSRTLMDLHKHISWRSVALRSDMLKRSVYCHINELLASRSSSNQNAFRKHHFISVFAVEFAGARPTVIWSRSTCIHKLDCKTDCDVVCLYLLLPLFIATCRLRWSDRKLLRKHFE